MNGWVFLDLDGTLVDSLAVARETFTRFLRDHGTEPAEGEFDELNGATLHQIAAWLRERCALTDEVELVRSTYEAGLAQRYERDVQAMAGADALLGHLRAQGRPLALVTAGPSTLVDALLERLGWQEHFSVVVTGDDVARAKPEPDPYLVGLSRSAASAADAVAVEDSINGVRAAAAAGLRVIGVSSAGDAGALARAGACTVVDGLAEVGAVLDVR